MNWTASRDSNPRQTSPAGLASPSDDGIRDVGLHPLQLAASSLVQTLSSTTEAEGLRRSNGTCRPMALAFGL
jgi:hypothetical protein